MSPDRAMLGDCQVQDPFPHATVLIEVQHKRIESYGRDSGRMLLSPSGSTVHDVLVLVHSEMQT